MIYKNDTSELTEEFNDVAKEADRTYMQQQKKELYDMAGKIGKTTGPATLNTQENWDGSPFNLGGAAIGAEINKSSSAAGRVNSADLFKTIDERVYSAAKSKKITREYYFKLERLQYLAGKNPEIVELIELMKELS